MTVFHFLALSQVRICSPLRNGQIFMKDAQCAETNEKLIFRFLLFELLMFFFLTIFKCFSTEKGQKLCLSQKMRNVLIGVFVLVRFFV